MRKGRTFVVSGPSGVGKSTVLKALLESRKNLYFSVSATTRDPRPGELDGIHYHFMDVESFRKWIAMDQFLEYAEYVGNFYGTPKKFVDDAMEAGKDVILDIEIQGAIQVCSKRPDTVRIFIAPPRLSRKPCPLTRLMSLAAIAIIDPPHFSHSLSTILSSNPIIPLAVHKVK